MILWFMDRMGLPGQYHATWVRLLRDSYIPTNEVRVLQLHKALPNKQLLVKIGNRKAPTWNPEHETLINNTIQGLVDHAKPRAVVLSSPESLAILGLNPEHATLHNLRGSVYWRDGIPFLVTLPMSAWFSMVSQKEIGAANYGYESAEQLAAGQQGAIQASLGGEGSTGIRSGGAFQAGGDGELRDSGRGTDDDELEDDDADSDSDSSDSDGGPDGAVSESDVEHDEFFYEPVLSPVGRFVLTADTQKLFRLLRDGKNAGGPSQPVELRWR